MTDLSVPPEYPRRLGDPSGPPSLDVYLFNSLSAVRVRAQISRAVNGDGHAIPPHLLQMAGAPTGSAAPAKRSKALALVEERLALMEEEGVGGTSWDTAYAACA